MVQNDIIRMIQEKYSLDLQQQLKAEKERAEELEMSNKLLSARIKEAEEENRKLRGIMVQLRKTERPEKCSVVFEMTYSDALSAEQVGTVAGYVFRAIMKADQEKLHSRKRGDFVNV